MSEALLRDHLADVMERLDKAQRQAAEATAELDAAHGLLTVLGVPRETREEGYRSPLSVFTGGFRTMTLAERLLTVRHRIAEEVQRARAMEMAGEGGVYFKVGIADPFGSKAPAPKKKRGRPKK